MATVDVAIVGGGIAGLAAAYELRQRGVSRPAFSKRHRAPGGVITTERVDGWVIDGGPDSMLVQKPAAVALCRELGLGDRLISTLTPRTAYVLRDGRLHPLAEGSFLGFPLTFSALARSSLFTIGGKLRLAGELLIPRRAATRTNRSARSCGVDSARKPSTISPSRCWPASTPATSTGCRCARCFRACSKPSVRSGSVLRAFRALRVTPSPQGAFVSLPGGTGELVDALLAALPGIVHTGARVTDIRRAGSLILESRHRPAAGARGDPGGAGVRRRLAAARVRHHDRGVLRRRALRLDRDRGRSATGANRSRIRCRARVSSCLASSDPRCSPARGSRRSGRAARPTATSLLRGFLGGGRDPHRLDAGDEELIETARDELEDLLDITGDPVFTRFFRWTRQSPQYEVGHLQRVAAIDDRLAALPGVFLTGSGFRAIGIPDCIADARATAARAAAYASARHADVT